MNAENRTEFNYFYFILFQAFLIFTQRSSSEYRLDDPLAYKILF